MQVELFTIPIKGGEAILKEMNVFLRSKKILQVEKHFVNNHQGTYWCYVIEYIDVQTSNKATKKPKPVDYKAILDEVSYKRYSAMRVIRKRLSDEEGIPAYAVFTNKEMAALAVIPELTLAKMKKVEGIGEGKIKKYGQHFVKNEKSQ